MRLLSCVLLGAALVIYLSPLEGRHRAAEGPGGACDPGSLASTAPPARSRRRCRRPRSQTRRRRRWCTRRRRRPPAPPAAPPAPPEAPRDDLFEFDQVAAVDLMESHALARGTPAAADGDGASEQHLQRRERRWLRPLKLGGLGHAPPRDGTR